MSQLEKVFSYHHCTESFASQAMPCLRKIHMITAKTPYVALFILLPGHVMVSPHPLRLFIYPLAGVFKLSLNVFSLLFYLLIFAHFSMYKSPSVFRSFV